MKWQRWNSAATCPGLHEGAMQKQLGARGEYSYHACRRAEREYSCLSLCLCSSGTLALCSPVGFSLCNGDHCHALFPLNYMSAASQMSSAQIPTLLTAVTVVKMLPQRVRPAAQWIMKYFTASFQRDTDAGVSNCKTTSCDAQRCRWFLERVMQSAISLLCIKSIDFYKSISRVMSLSNVMSLWKGHAVHNCTFLCWNAATPHECVLFFWCKTRRLLKHQATYSSNVF